MHSFSVSKALCVVGIFSCLVAQPAAARAADFTFNTGDTAIPQGTGERIIQAYYPALSGRGFGSQLELQMQPYVNTLASQLRSTVETRLNALNFGPLVSRSATAGAAAARATSVDHASFIKVFSLTAAGSVAVSGFDAIDALQDLQGVSTKVQNGEAPNYGAAPGASAMLGFNFGALNLRHWGFFNPNRLQLYVSAMVVNLHYNGDEVQAKNQNFGAHLKYQLFAPSDLTANTLVRWGGLNVASGLTWASTDFAFNTALPNGTAETSAPVSVAGTTQNLNLTGVWSGDADINLHLRAYTVPLEVSSFIQLLYVFTLFGGVAMDLNFGSLSVDASAKAPLAITASAPGNPTAVDLLTPKPTLDFAMTRSPVRIDGRVFLGLQLNAGVVALYAQGMVDTSQTMLASAGLRAFY